WTAGTETGGTITKYLVQRCMGAGCSNFVQVGTSTTTTFNDTGLTGSTSYSYRVQATDAAGNLSGFSTAATAVTSAPTFTAPSSLTATAAGPSQINLAWTAGTESGGTISQYLVQRCMGAGCNNFVQVGTSTTTTFNDTGLTGSTSYSYRVQATDAAGNLSAFSSAATAVTSAPTFTAPSSLTATAAGPSQINLAWTAGTETGGTISQYLVQRCMGAGCSNFVQVGTSTTTTFNDTGLTGSTSYSYRAQATDAAGNLSGFSTAATAVTSAPTFTAPSSLTATAAGPSQINLAWTAGTETGGTISQYLVQRCMGAGCSNFAQVGTSTTTTFGDTGLSASTSYSYRVQATDAAGNLSGFSTAATAVTSAPTFTAPSSLTATAAGPSQINLAWTAGTETGGTISQYLVQRCMGAGCSNFVQVGTSTTTTFNDTGLTGSTSYSYRAQATDAAGNLSGFSTAATAVTSAPTFTAPSSLTATAAGPSQINLAWTAGTESGGTISQYLVQRCMGAGCSNFVQVGTSTSTTFNDTGLTGSTSYSYRVQATDAAGNLSAFSNAATAVTSAPTIAAPLNLSAIAAGPSQINLAWTAGTETGGTISQYLVQRCMGAGCSNFAQVGTSTTATFNDTGLSASTSYSYRVQATDAAGNLSAFSSAATAVTSAPTFTAPSSLTATAAGPSQINLAWTAGTETGGTISQYLVQRCMGAGCSNFVQVGTSTTTTFNDTGLSASTSY